MHIYIYVYIYMHIYIYINSRYTACIAVDIQYTTYTMCLAAEKTPRPLPQGGGNHLAGWGGVWGSLLIYIGYKYGLSQDMVHTSICNRKVVHHFSMCFLIEMAIKSTAHGIFGSFSAPVLAIITLHIYIYIYIYIHIHIYMFERYSYLC